MSNEKDRFQEIADQLLRDDPRFFHRASEISSGRVPTGKQLRRLLAVLSLVGGFVVMIASLILNIPFLGLVAFVAMLAGTVPAARDLSSRLQDPWITLGRNRRDVGRRGKE